uniref:T9SS type A sorting domain-containing protein n=1 Tax=Eiseniibacteriota bacterium TaxID=2212470 RepID=A0A832I3Y7_UNCEI
MRWKHTLPAALLALAIATPASAAVQNLVFGSGYAVASYGAPSTARAFTGSGSWYELYPSTKFELYVDVAAQFGTSFTIDQIASITYHTNNNATNPSNVDFYLLLYTQPFVGGDASWYGRRLTAEPYLANGFVPPTAGVWNAYSTSAGANQLTFFDSNHCGNFGFYGAPTLADLQAGPITWNAWPTNLGSGDGVPFDYGAQSVRLLSFQTGSGWAAFEGWLDAITVNLTNGDSYVIDLESAVDPVYANDDWTGAAPGVEVAPGRWIGHNAFATVQDAVTAAVPGGTVHVLDGTYTEQVVVDGKNLTIDGESRAGTVIQSPVSLTQSFSTGPNNFPVVFVKNAADVRVQDLTIDGAGRGNANYRFIGIAWWNAGGKLLNADVKRIEDTPFSGSQHGVGVYANSNTGGPYTLEVGNVAISDFQKNGTVFAAALPPSATSLTVDMHDCVVTGKGATGVTAQNGIQVSGASATLTNNTVTGIGYSGTGWVGTSLLLWGPGAMNVSGGAVTNGQIGAYFIDADGSTSNLDVSLPAMIGQWTEGIVLYNQSTGPAASAAAPARGEGGAARPQPSPMDVDASAAAKAAGDALTAGMTVAISGGCLTGPGTASTWGVDVYSAGGPVTASVSNVEISNWDVGIEVYGSNVSMTANDNAITGNASAGYSGAAGNTHDAQSNWWGAASGPSGAGPGTGDAVIGATVDFTPWLVSGADLNPACGFTPLADNAVTAGPAPGCITPATPCLTIPVNIVRSSSEPMRGFSVDIQLSGGLTLCGSISEGTYLSSVGGTNFQVLSNGGGSYTVDCAILGLPCGAGAPGGLLFTIPVTSALPGGTGTVTVTAVTLRDCDNAPIAGSAGAPLSITIDNVAPAAIAGLAASQVKTGNDADGTTRIALSWPAAEAGATVEVYRAGFGNYPEYDDAPGAGSVPAVPSYPPAGPWVLAGTTTGTSLLDEVGTRDFWYYVAFVVDACGNVSAASNRTNGTLNYHLGDVFAGGNCTGNNLVNTADVSFLGGNYGITLGVSDPLGCLDVGPTTDFSVNARPTTDNRVQFEDLMMFAINYGVVSAPQLAARPVAAAGNAVALRVPALPGVGSTFAVGVDAEFAGGVQGVSVALGWNAAVVEPVSVEAGELLARQATTALALSSEAGAVDLAVFGSGATFAGSGEAARVIFRVKAAGDPAIVIRSLDGRDTHNRRVTLDGGRPVASPDAAAARTALGIAFPNPFGEALSIQWSLKRETAARLAVFDVSGRRVRTLLDGPQAAGSHLVRWDGRGDGGVLLAPGFYVIRLEAGEVVQTKTVRLVR